MNRLMMSVMVVAMLAFAGCMEEDAAVDDQEQVGSVEQAEETPPAPPQDDLSSWWNVASCKATCDATCDSFEDCDNCEEMCLQIFICRGDCRWRHDPQ